VASVSVTSANLFRRYPALHQWEVQPALSISLPPPSRPPPSRSATLDVEDGFRGRWRSHPTRIGASRLWHFRWSCCSCRTSWNVRRHWISTVFV